MNATQACIRAGYSKINADAIGPELLAKTWVSGRIQELMNERSKRTQIDQDYVVQRLHELESFDFGEIFDENGAARPMDEWPDYIRRSIASIEVTEVYDGKGEDREIIGYVKKFKIENRSSSIVKLGQHLGMFNTMVEGAAR